MPRGGKRPGAGAPRGNLNALRTGKHSAQYKRLLEILARDQEAVRLLEEIALGDQKRAERRRRGVYPERCASSSRRAMQVLAQLLKQQEQRALDRTIDEWERLRTMPTSILDIPSEANPVRAWRGRGKR